MKYAENDEKLINNYLARNLCIFLWFFHRRNLRCYEINTMKKGRGKIKELHANLFLQIEKNILSICIDMIELSKNLLNGIGKIHACSWLEDMNRRQREAVSVQIMMEKMRQKKFVLKAENKRLKVPSRFFLFITITTESYAFQI